MGRDGKQAFIVIEGKLVIISRGSRLCLDLRLNGGDNKPDHTYLIDLQSVRKYAKGKESFFVYNEDSGSLKNGKFGEKLDQKQIKEFFDFCCKKFLKSEDVRNEVYYVRYECRLAPEIYGKRTVDMDALTQKNPSVIPKESRDSDEEIVKFAEGLWRNVKGLADVHSKKKPDPYLILCVRNCPKMEFIVNKLKECSVDDLTLVLYDDCDCESHVGIRVDGGGIERMVNGFKGRYPGNFSSKSASDWLVPYGKLGNIGDRDIYHATNVGVYTENGPHIVEEGYSENLRNALRGKNIKLITEKDDVEEIIKKRIDGITIELVR